MVIALGKSRKDIKWLNTDTTWESLVAKLGSTHRTRETMREYQAMGKEEQGKVKDVGGFVGGRLNGGHRKNEAVVDRCLVTLDADNAFPELLLDVELIWDWEMVVYSTHSHTPENPRLRFVIPLSRPVAPEEYVPIARKLASKIGIDTMDPSTYEPCRLMYWPSCSSDAEPVFQRFTGEFVNPDKVLAEYGLDDAWKDSTLWPIAKGEQEVRVKEAKRQGDPEEKPGIVGLFCRTYTIEDAMDELIPGVYEPAGEKRFTYVAGSTAAGAVMYEDKFLYSHHGTDPCGGQLVNAFDLVRIHKFGERDAGLENQEVTRRPSYQVMCEFAAGLDKVKTQRVSEQSEMLDDLSGGSDGSQDDDTDWMTKLDLNKKTGEIEPTTPNIELILQNDPALKGLIAFNLMRNKRVLLRHAPWDRNWPTRKGDIPTDGAAWTDDDNSGLRSYMERVYHIVSKDKIRDAVNTVRMLNAFDPLQDYLTGLVWDGVERLDTMLIQWMGAEDTPYVRAVTRKWMCGAVARAMNPGCKFDNMLVLIGPQGIGKSTLAETLSRGYFTDSLGRMNASKDSYERLFGVWIVEVAELASVQKTDSEDVKNFITKKEDKFRKAYAEEDGIYKRRCVFFGTTNNWEFLRDSTGNRRFWPVEVKGFNRGQLIGFADEVDQLWAEAMVRWREGEPLWISDPEIKKLEKAVQDNHTVTDDWRDAITDYLNTLLPANWENMDAQQRRGYFDWSDMYMGICTKKEEGVKQRDCVSIPEIKWELFGIQVGQEKSGYDFSSRRISNIMNTLRGWKKIDNRYRDKLYGHVSGWERKEDSE
ncbi:MAG: hypothetical protein IJH38_08160 [Clostridia bacterium]|nr:hypothetical protein [Clostridia bacterium]